MSNVFIDIETLPDMSEGAKDLIEVKAPAQFKKPESIAKWIEEKGPAEREKLWRKQALNPNEGQILSIAWNTGGETVCCTTNDFSHDSSGPHETNERALIESFCEDLVGELKGRPPYFIGHNVPFDLGFIWKRAIVNNIELPFTIKPHGRHGSDFFDTMQQWEGFKGRISQDRLCKLLGIEGKPDGISGANVLDHYLAGDIDKIAAYNKDDVDKVKSIYNRIK